MKKILEVKNLNKYFISKFGVNKAVDNVSFDLHEGEVLGLIGQSGSGKTTIGKALLRLLPEVNGIVSYNDQLISGNKISKNATKLLRKDIQAIFQDPHSSLNEKRNIYSTLIEPLKTHNVIEAEYKEFFKDWETIVRVFIFSLKTAYHQEELNFIKNKNEQKIGFYRNINKFLDDYKIDTTQSMETNIDILLSAYYSDRFAINRNLITTLVESEKHLFSKYDTFRKEYIQRKVSKDELEYIKAHEAYTDYIAKKNDLQNRVKIIETVSKDCEKAKKKLADDTKNNVKSAMSEFKNKMKFHNEISQISKNFNSSELSTFKAATSKLGFKLVKNIPTEIKYLKTTQIIDMVTRLHESIELHATNVIHDFKSQAIQGNTGKEKLKIKKEHLKNAIAKLSEGTFDFTAYIELSNKNEKEIEDKFNKVSNDLVEKFNLLEKQISPEAEAKLMEQVEIARKINDEEIEKYRLNWQPNFDKLIEDIQTNSINWDNEELTKLKQSAIEKFNKITKNIIIELKKQDRQAVKSFKAQLVESKIRNQAFDYEVKKLVKDLEKIKYIFNLKEVHPFLRKRIFTNILYTKKIFNAIETVGLKAEHVYRYPHEFSGGQKQRINIARAIINEPKILIADEPIASLDISIQAQIVNLLLDLVKTKGISLIFIAHDLTMVEYIADNVLIMHLGRIVEYGKTEFVFKKPTHSYTKTLFDAVPRISNANTPFKHYDAVDKYLFDYSATSLPKYHQLDAHNHFVLASEDQLKKWTNKNSLSTKNQKNEVGETAILSLPTERPAINPANSLDLTTPEIVENNPVIEAIFPSKELEELKSISEDTDSIGEVELKKKILAPKKVVKNQTSKSKTVNKKQTEKSVTKATSKPVKKVAKK